MPRALLGRLVLLASFLALDCLLLASVPHAEPLLGPLAPFGIVSFAVFVGLGYSRLKPQREESPFGFSLLALHALCVAAVSLVDLAALRGLEFPLPLAAVFFGLRLVLVAGIALLALACLPLKTWARVMRTSSPLWIYALISGLLAWSLRFPLQSLWNASSTAGGRFLQMLAFDSVRALLRLFLSNVVYDPAAFTIGAPHFAVYIAEACSGMEGLGLVLVFTTVWLVYYRKESRFPQALLLVPCALASVWLLNIVRIAALICIGNAGAPDVAMVGFHSQAGWIAFTTVAFSFSMATRKISWVRKAPPLAAFPATPLTAQANPPGHTALSEPAVDAGESDRGESPATPAYLVPFLAILAASFLSKAASGYFEWLYPLRFLAAAFALWRFRSQYKRLNWRFGWGAPAVGAAVFAVWVLPSWWSRSAAHSPLGDALTALSPAARLAWIAIRVAAAVVTVPIAEELAFRGYLARRVSARDFDEIALSRLSLAAIALSSIAFGLMHGQHWFVGTLAGLAYACIARRSGRFGDAVAAHATSNLLLAAWVLLRGDWGQW